MTPWFHPAAEQEVAAALKVGEERGFGLGRELVQEIRRVSAFLCDLPLAGEPLDIFPVAPRRESTMWINQLRLLQAQPRIAQPHR